MDKDKLIEQLMDTFLGELEEHVQTLDRVLLALERGASDPDRRELLNTLFRTAHSLKGAARAVNQNVLEATCHELEAVLATIRDDGRLGPMLFELLFSAADALRDTHQRLLQKRPLEPGPLGDLRQRLRNFDPSQSTNPPGPAATADPPSTPAPLEAPRTLPEVSPSLETTQPEATATTVLDLGTTTTDLDASTTTTVLSPDKPSPLAGLEDDGSVRIHLRKLDDLMSHSGELLTARRAMVARNADLDGLQDSLRRSRGEWRKMERVLKKLLQTPSARSALRLGSYRSAPDLARQLGEHLNALQSGLERLGMELEADQRRLEQAAVPLEQAAHRLRMSPFSEACKNLERAVRDLAKSSGKEAELVVVGGDVELDRSVLEGLKAPLLHLVRNAVDHGIETPAERLEQGKPLPARITVAANLRSGQVEISVTDDGRGLDRAAIRTQAQQRGLTLPQDERDLARMIFLPGLSTARQLTEISGRGMGLDIVRSRMEELHGTIELQSKPAAWTRFTLTVPLTLGTIRGLLVRAGTQTFAIPMTNVRRLLRLHSQDLRNVHGRPTLTLDGSVVPAAALADALGLPDVATTWTVDPAPFVLLSSGDQRIALRVDELISEEELVVKGLGTRLRRIRNIAAATILPDGLAAFILNTAELLQSALGKPGLSMPARAAAKPARKRLLVCDDSLTTRALVQSILEAAGYQVMTAPDGAAGWRLLQEQGADLVVSDVEMPAMNGYELTETIRSSARFRDLPVILVTGLASDRDRARGLEAGASAYLVKSAFDQSALLQVIAQLS